MEPDAGAIRDDLAAAGLRIPEAGRAADGLMTFLGSMVDQVTLEQQMGLCALLDPAHLRAEHHRG